MSHNSRSLPLQLLESPTMSDAMGPDNHASPNKRQRVGYSSSSGGNLRMCAHCGRTFKRTEHLERHIRTRESRFWLVRMWSN